MPARQNLRITMRDARNPRPDLRVQVIPDAEEAQVNGPRFTDFP